MNIDANKIINKLSLRIAQLETDKALLEIQLEMVKEQSQEKQKELGE